MTIIYLYTPNTSTQYTGQYVYINKLTPPKLHRLNRHPLPLRRLRQPPPHSPPLRPPLRSLHLRHRRVLPPRLAPLPRPLRLRHLLDLPHRRRRPRRLQGLPAQPGRARPALRVLQGCRLPRGRRPRHGDRQRRRLPPPFAVGGAGAGIAHALARDLHPADRRLPRCHGQTGCVSGFGQYGLACADDSHRC